MKQRSLLFRGSILALVLGFAWWQRYGTEPITVEPGTPTSSTAPSAAVEKNRYGYEVWEGCQLIDDEGNDGDSFTVRHGGERVVIRLYFVDSPESYLSDRHESQQRRVREQADDLGGLTDEQTVAIGKKAKETTRAWLRAGDFTVLTYREPVYEGDRFYGFVTLADGRDLGESLIKEGLVRIHTKGPGSKEKPVPTPEGKSFLNYRDGLRRLEKTAQSSGRGAWGE